MQKLREVEEARAIMTEAGQWSMWRWLTEKPKVRRIADVATAALADANAQVKETWSDELKAAYAELVAEAELDGNAAAKKRYEKARKAAEAIDPKIKAAAKRVKDADDEAARVTQEAEDAFAEADRRMSASMARDSTKIALESYDLRESAIRKSEVAARK
jgi:hypothetical protein